ncbi:hypothetical protein [Flavobacterium piscis]|uniref:Uncharacterized protein n=1 Tax=Flavobacterium piscis TaxID=1114874 RepID=A0ABU1YDX5_9FLAO|nr:hypothetical protein [Flavobacterium piscis]MDR7212434.1 hypothetical protein [Flavobacterium piscis]
MDNEAVNKVKQKNGELNTYLARRLVNLEFDLKMKKNEDVILFVINWQLLKIKF